ncbi:hypothetical protein LOC68_06960 [Blastopirellula sp. JC732]|uniref:Uncharacterized protein n=1 Tax=Blastopirellula sediminis TaxID=2894196 RepID=A0A9X1MKX5_9BACT|nr:hypothetical protein [Blastopirellula sediminis]MCC9609093.1 hypothetical protein [Blastopirellula sediminis]MCC9628130.1 hypothetical protein [Blastopirellula sediminis]
MGNAKIDLEQVRGRYGQWLESVDRSFNRHRASFVNAMDWIEPESVVNADNMLKSWSRPAASRPSAYRYLIELSKAGVLLKRSDDGALEYAVKEDFFGETDSSGA